MSKKPQKASKNAIVTRWICVILALLMIVGGATTVFASCYM